MPKYVPTMLQKINYPAQNPLSAHPTSEIYQPMAAELSTLLPLVTQPVYAQKVPR